MERAISKAGLPVGWLIIAALAIVAFFATANGQTVSRVESVGFTVSDMDRAIDFYTRVLPFEKIEDMEVWGSEFEKLSGVFGARVRIVRLRLGDEVLELTEYLTPQGRAIPSDSRSNDRWFQHVAIIVSDMDKAYAHLRANKVRYASTAPQTLPTYITAAAGISAFYFKDPDGHVLEVLSFPPDKGARKWHELKNSGRLFLGVDHTAIVVGDTEESLKFYRDALGLAVAGESMNYGPEQEHLNNVAGARLRITGLKTEAAGINVEFLEYLSPRDGRLYPADSKSNDLWHWQTSFQVDAIDALLEKLKPNYISPTVLLKNFKPRFREASLMRDRDGHAIRLITKRP